MTPEHRALLELIEEQHTFELVRYEYLKDRLLIKVVTPPEHILHPVLRPFVEWIA